MQLSLLDYLRKHVDGTLTPDDTSRMQYPSPIAVTLGFNLIHIAVCEATIELDTVLSRHANPMGTIHGGVLCDLSDMAIGTAHATTLKDDESFTSVDLKINFFRPLWDAKIRGAAKVVHLGKTTSFYECQITREDGKLVAMVASTVMTLRGAKSEGR
jgi:uncharacterized protein (TIGR00369 family)